jgi:hypothetical protein
MSKLLLNLAHAERQSRDFDLRVDTNPVCREFRDSALKRRPISDS